MVPAFITLTILTVMWSKEKHNHYVFKMQLASLPTTCAQKTNFSFNFKLFSFRYDYLQLFGRKAFVNLFHKMSSTYVMSTAGYHDYCVYYSQITYRYGIYFHTWISFGYKVDFFFYLFSGCNKLLFLQLIGFLV